MVTEAIVLDFQAGSSLRKDKRNVLLNIISAEDYSLNRMRLAE